MSNHMTITTEDALKVARRLVAYHGYPGEAADARLVARALLSTSAAERRLREALPLAVAALEEAEAILGGEYGDQHAVLCERMADLRAALSPKGEDELATRGEDAAPTPTSTKDTTNA